jgi:hypothetical protein
MVGATGIEPVHLVTGRVASQCIALYSTAEILALSATHHYIAAHRATLERMLSVAPLLPGGENGEEAAD